MRAPLRQPSALVIPLPDLDLAYLVEGTGEFWAYIRDLRWAQHFALLNREEMIHSWTASRSGSAGPDPGATVWR
jgi:tRNA-splicing ligase RtcB (3'-phosphate/5'-hydroxy nucleic acid ligase)